MKKIITILISILALATAFAQAPEKMSYQAVIRDASDALLTNTTIGMQISILEGSATGTAVYVETHMPTTNANGLVSIIIGNGTVVLGDLTTVDWGSDSHYIKTETDPSGGTTYSIEATVQLLSVPYALYSKNGGSGNTLDQAYDKEMTTASSTRTIMADDGTIEIVSIGNSALELRPDDTNDGLVVENIGAEEGIDLSNSGTGDGVLIDNTSTGDGLKVINDSLGDAIDVESIGGGDAISIDNAGTGDALFIDNTDGVGSSAISVNNDGGSAAVDILNDGGGSGILLVVDGGGEGMLVIQDGVGDGIEIDNDGTGTGLVINNEDNAGSEDAIDIANDGGGDAISIDNAGAGDALFIDNTDSTGSSAISVNNDGGSAAVDILNDGGGSGILLTVDGGGDGMLVTQDGTGDGIEIDNDGSGTGLSINNEDNTGGKDALNIANDGGGAGMSLSQLGDGNALDVMNGGTAVGVNIVNGNPAGIGKVLTIFQANDEGAVDVDNSGLGKGVRIFNGNPFADIALEIVQAGVEPALLVDNAGVSKGVFIFNGDPLNADNALYASTSGTGSVSRFMTDDNNANTEPTVFAENFGTGSAGLFIVADEPTGKVNFSPAVNIISNGKGTGLNVDITNDLPGSDSNIVPAIKTVHRGYGHAGYFEALNISNPGPAVEIINKSIGYGLHIDSFDNPGGFVDESLYVEQANDGGVATFEQHMASTTVPEAVLISSGATSSAHATLRVVKADPTKLAAVLEGNVEIATDLTVGGKVTSATGEISVLDVPTSITAGTAVISDLTVTSSISAPAKAFKIDHPLDPDNKYLVHNSIESNERINIYSGNITTNEEGYATVQLPEYMNALNTDFKYQLTIIDKSFAQAIIWEPMNEETNSFVIKTDTPSIKVSWQITGTRQDKWAKENPMEVEIEKNNEF